MRNIFIEGIQGAGKSTLLQKIYTAITSYRVCREGDYSPVDLAWCTWMSKEEYNDTLSRYHEAKDEIIKNTFTEGDNYIISYTKIITDIPNFHKELENYEIYNGRKSFEEFKDILFSGFRHFSETGYLFECAFFQNIMEDLMLYHMLTDDEIIEFYRELYGNINRDEFLLLYLYSDNLEESIRAIKEERSDSTGNPLWYGMMLQYLINSPYGTAHGYSDFKDMVEHFTHRQNLEMRIIKEVVGDKAVIIPAKSWKIYTPTIFDKDKYRLAESPFYVESTDTISWVDILAGKMYLLDGAGNKNVIDFKQPVGAAVPANRTGSYVVAGMDGLYILEDGQISLLYDLSDTYRDFIRSNDAKADPVGRLWFGSSVADDIHEPQGNLYCYDNKSACIKQPDTKISNGMAWNSDGTKFFFSDSGYHAVFVYDYDLDTGSITNRKILFETDNGVPDGMCIDAEDNLWVAIWGGYRVEKRNSITGEKMADILLSARNVTSCCFTGKDYDTLFITTSGENLHGESDGCLFTCQVEEKGVAPDYANID